jgi:hypothetical protein
MKGQLLRENETNLNREMKTEHHLPWKLDIGVRKMATGLDLDVGHDLQQQSELLFESP